jgi:hypothetical protein
MTRLDVTTRQILTVQGNLTNFHSQKYSGITNSKVCHLEVGGDNLD